MKLRLWVKIFLPIIIVGAGFMGFKKLNAMKSFAKRKQTTTTQAVAVQLATVSPNQKVLSLLAIGILKPSKELSIQAQVPGELIFVDSNVVPGGRVTAGQTLLRIDPRDYEVTLEQRKAQLVNARMQLKQEQGRQAVAKREWALLGTSIKTTPSGRSLALREPQITQAKATISSARSAIKGAQLGLERTKIKAPFDAVVRSEQVEKGQRVGPGQSIIRLVGTEIWWIEVAIPLDQLKHIDVPGTEALIHQGNRVGLGRRGTVIRQLPDVDRASQLARIIVEVKDPMTGTDHPALLLGTAVNITLLGNPMENATRIPVSILRNGKAVWQIDSEKRMKVTPVNVLWREGDFVLVEGLKAGELVISNHVPNAAPGLAVRVVEQDDKPQPATVASPKKRSDKASN
jgi:RND family efflux transporter MFP subunit